ncbi:hypothetical protein AB4144_26825, partial [Rhizobiaceae sp. 2RAB30]
MLDLLEIALLWISAVGCGLLAGVCFAFSAFIMKSLARIDQAAGISAMNAIDAAIVKSAFMPIFLGTTLTSLALVGISLSRWAE